MFVVYVRRMWEWYLKFDDIGHKQVHTGVPFDGNTVIKYLLVCQTQDSGLAHKH